MSAKVGADVRVSLKAALDRGAREGREIRAIHLGSEVYERFVEAIGRSLTVTAPSAPGDVVRFEDVRIFKAAWADSGSPVIEWSPARPPLGEMIAALDKLRAGGGA